jgi:hypothetical protein
MAYKPTMTDEQRAVLMARFADTRTAELAQEMGVAYRVVCRWAVYLGLKKSKEFSTAMSALAGKQNKMPCKGRKREERTTFDDGKKAYMREYFATTPNIVLAKILGANDRTIRRWAAQLGLKKDREVIELYRRCKILPTPEEWFQIVCTIRELYPDGRDVEAARLTGYSVGYIQDIARKYGFKRNDAYRQRMKDELRDRRYPPQLMADMAAYFPTHTDKECAERFGMPKPTIQGMARRFGWKKTVVHVQKMFLSNIAAAQEHNRKKRN